MNSRLKRKKAYHTNCWGALGGDAVGVTSIGRLTYRTFADMERAVADIAQAGYEGVELFDGNLLDYEGRTGDFRRLLERNGVSFVAVYSGGNFIFGDILGEELSRIERVADAAADAGAQHLVVGGGAKRVTGSGPDDYKSLGAALDRVAELANRRGLRAHYHPHLTTMVESPEQVRNILALTGIQFCPDTAHLAAAGGDPAEMIREHKSRISYVHLKGWQRNPFSFTPLDAGDLDITAILRTLDEIEFDGWITVELDAWPDPKEGAVRSLSFLQRFEGASE
jgi:inosose dehydratase